MAHVMRERVRHRSPMRAALAAVAAGGLLEGTLSEGALKAGLETLTPATASSVATSQLTELAA